MNGGGGGGGGGIGIRGDSPPLLEFSSSTLLKLLIFTGKGGSREAIGAIWAVVFDARAVVTGGGGGGGGGGTVRIFLLFPFLDENKLRKSGGGGGGGGGGDGDGRKLIGA